LTFNNPAPADLDDFAPALAGGDGRVFIATHGLDDRIYAFSTTDGGLLHTISNPDGQGGNFATWVAYGSGSVLTSSPAYFDPGLQMDIVGRAYLFDARNGLLQRPLPNPEPKAGDAFGSGKSLAVFGNRAVVGADTDDLPGDTQPDGDNPGRVWVFDRLTGQTVFTLENPNPQKSPPNFFSDWFGSRIAASDEVIAVGALFDHTSGIEDSGTVYIFDSETGVLRHTLFGPQSERNGRFGETIAITPDGNVLVGAWNTTILGEQATGHAYLFDGMTGDLLLDIRNPELEQFGAFGVSVAATEQLVFVGAPAAGAVYVFEGIPEPSALALAGTVLAVVLGWSRIRRMKEAGHSLTHKPQGDGSSPS
jgi:outer membrane protein assembly factor BamB